MTAPKPILRRPGSGGPARRSRSTPGPARTTPPLGIGQEAPHALARRFDVQAAFETHRAEILSSTRARLARTGRTAASRRGRRLRKTRRRPRRPRRSGSLATGWTALSSRTGERPQREAARRIGQLGACASPGRRRRSPTGPCAPLIVTTWGAPSTSNVTGSPSWLRSVIVNWTCSLLPWTWVDAARDELARVRARNAPAAAEARVLRDEHVHLTGVDVVEVARLPEIRRGIQTKVERADGMQRLVDHAAVRLDARCPRRERKRMAVRAVGWRAGVARHEHVVGRIDADVRRRRRGNACSWPRRSASTAASRWRRSA